MALPLFYRHGGARWRLCVDVQLLCLYVLLSQAFFAGKVGSIQSTRAHSLPAFAWRAPTPVQTNLMPFHKTNVVTRAKLGGRAITSLRARYSEYPYMNDDENYPGNGRPAVFRGYLNPKP